MKYFKSLFLSVFILALLTPKISEATSGACSYHGGVNCAKGWQAEGTVYCNDNNWTGSIVFYDFMVMCEDERFAPECTDYIRGKDQYLKEIYQKISDAETDMAYADTSNPFVAQRWENYLDYLYTLRDRQISRYNDIARICTDDVNRKQQQYLLSRKTKLSCPEGTIFSNNNCITHTENCKNYYGDKVYGISGNNGDSSCFCLTGHEWNASRTNCVKSFEVNSEFSGGGGGGYTIPEGALIRAIGDIDVYIVKYVGTKKFKRLVLSPSVFNNYGHLKWENIMNIDRSTMDSFTTSDLVRAAGDSRIYRLYPSGDTGQKRLIGNSNVLAKYGLDSDSIYEINSFDRDSYIAGSVLE